VSITLVIPEEYYIAGRINSEVREDIRKKIRVGLPILEIAEIVENGIRSKGAQPAFPCNICINSVAAHFSPAPNETSKILDGDIVKIDIGTHVNGYIADTAFTTSFNPEYDLLVQTANDMLDAAIKTVKVGVKVGDIGQSIYQAASRLGLKPISNLSGHAIDQFKVHAGLSIPNIYVSGLPSLKSGQVYAIEPFVTTQKGAGVVVNGNRVDIFSLVARKRTGDKNLDNFADKIWGKYKTLPFAFRHLLEFGDSNSVSTMIKQLVQKHIARDYAILVEEQGEPVAQAEHTIVPVDGGVIVLTE
jgi:methionyl aminopeptidase